MGTRWVYRRPHFPVHKPKIPLTRGGFVKAPIRRRYQFRVRRRIVRARMVMTFGVTAQQTFGQAFARSLRRRAVQRHAQPLRRVPAPGGRFEGKQGPIQRMLKAVARMRRAMQARLRWKPRPEFIPPVIPGVPVHAIPRGTIQSAGAEAGSIFSAGSKRGKVGGSRG